MKTSHLRLVLGAACITLGLGAAPARAQNVVDGPDTLFLTWFDDPCTTIVAQWLEEGEPLPIMPGATDEVPAFDTPRLDGVTIDGDDGDWAGRGLEAGYLAGEDGRVYAPDDASAAARIGWDARGLLVTVRVRDDIADESQEVDALWAGDSVELFVSTGVGSDQRYQVLIASGADVKQAEARQWCYDYRSDRSSGDPRVEYACRVVEGGYVVEVLLPWANLNIEPGTGDEVALQFYVNDRDGGEERDVLFWHPDHDAHERPESMYALRLSEKAGGGASARAKVENTDGLAELVVWTDAGHIGKTARAVCAGRDLGEAELIEHNGGASARIGLGDAPQGARLGTIDVLIDGERAAYARPMRWMMITSPEPENVICETRVRAGFRGHIPDGDGVSTVVRPFGNYTGLFFHRVTFDGLAPGEDHVLHIGGAGGTSVTFRTAPATMDGPVVFAEGGDVGWSERVAPLHDAAAKWSPLFGLIGGDVAYANGRTPESWVKYLRLWRRHMVDPEGRSIPMLCAIGNHEVDGSFAQPRERSPLFLALFDGVFPEVTYATIDFGDYLSLVLLDSGHLESHEDQAAWLDSVLEARKDVPHVFPVYHVPAYPSHREFEGKYSELARLHWVPLFERHGVKVAFEHHDHTYKRTHRLLGGEPHPEGVLYLGDGAWGMAPREVATPAQRPYLAKSVSACNVIRVTLDGAEQRFLMVGVDGEEIDRYPQGSD